ncbi:MAG: hypothetical protein QXX35_04540 [Desulfurococcaceae archaeon]
MLIVESLRRRWLSIDIELTRLKKFADLSKTIRKLEARESFESILKNLKIQTGAYSSVSLRIL